VVKKWLQNHTEDLLSMTVYLQFTFISKQAIFTPECLGLYE